MTYENACTNTTPSPIAYIPIHTRAYTYTCPGGFRIRVPEPVSAAAAVEVDASVLGILSH